MKLVTYELFTPLGPIRRVGALMPDSQVLDLQLACTAQLARKHGLGEARARSVVLVPVEMIRFLRRGQEALEAAREAIDFVSSTGERAGPDQLSLLFDLDEVRLLSPLPRPTSLRDFICFEQHIKNSYARMGVGEIPKAWYEMPVYYKGNVHTVIGPEQEVIWPGYATALDYELEIGMVIGKSGKDIPKERAREHIAGFTIFNDISVRNVQGPEMSVGLGPGKSKDFDTGNILGPCLVTKDEFDGRSGRMIARVNGEVWSEGSLDTLHYSFEDLIAHVSQSETLYSGDVFGSGTVGGGCGLELGRYLQPGDIVELEVEGIGILRNRISKK